MSQLLAGAPGDCCFTGVKHSGTPVGKTTSFADIPTYISAPSIESQSATGTAPKKVVLFFSDVYGPFYLNGQLVQDYFASQGFVVLGIDYFLGDPVHIHTEPDFDRDAWIQKSKQQAKEIVPGWLRAVRSAYGEHAKYTAVGYCFGGPFAVDLAATDVIVAAAIAHPAFITDEQLKRVKKPLLLSCAESDFTFPLAARRKAEDILVEEKATYTFQVFSGVSHGFAMRGDPEVGDSRWAKEESARGIIGWFTRFSQ